MRRRSLPYVLLAALLLVSARPARAEGDAARTPADSATPAAKKPGPAPPRFALDVEPTWVVLRGDAPSMGVDARGAPVGMGGGLAGGALGGGAFVRFRYARVGALASFGLLDGTWREHDRGVPYLYLAAAFELVGPGLLDRVHLGAAFGTETLVMRDAHSWGWTNSRTLVSGYVAGAYGRLDVLRIGAVSVYGRGGVDVRLEGPTGALARESGVLWGPRFGGGISLVL